MEKEVSCINTGIILKYVKICNNGDCSGLFVDLDPEIELLDDPEVFLADPNNWISCTVARKLYERARLLLNDEMVVYKAAKFAVENSSLGYLQKAWVKAFWSYRTALKHAQKINDKFNRSKQIEVVQVKGNEAVVRLHWDQKMDLAKDMCWMNRGIYTYMPLIWGGRPLSLKEKCCYFDGAPYCEYHLRWPARNKFNEIFSRFFATKSVLMETLKEMEEDKFIIERKYEEVNSLNVELNKRIKQIIAIQQTGEAIVSILDLGQLLTTIISLLSNVCQISHAVIMMVNEDEGYLELMHCEGFGNEISDDVKNYRVPLNCLNNILARVASTGRPEYVPDVRSSNLRKENVLLFHGKQYSLYVVPLIARSKVIGVIAMDGIGGRGVSNETRETLEVFAPQIAVAIENARLYGRLQEEMDNLKKSRILLSRTEKFSFLGNLAARLAHEIRNPMTAIGTFIQMLPQKYDDKEFREGFYKIAMEETNRVNNLITELMDLVKTRESHFSYADLHELIEKMILLVSPQTKAKKIEVVRSFDSSIGQVWMDSEKMKQVILNLLSNATEFVPQGGKIEIFTETRKTHGKAEAVYIKIKDDGEGIDPAIIDKIFDPYFTTKHKSTMHSGTGLGLSIAHQNMHDLGGNIEVKSVENEGACFILSLPKKPVSK